MQVLFDFCREAHEALEAVCKDLTHLSPTAAPGSVALLAGSKVRVQIFGEGVVVVAPREDDGIVTVDFGWAKGYLASSAVVAAVV